VAGGSGSDTGVNLFYSDNDGGSWTKPTGGDLDSSTANFAVAIDAAQDPDTSVWEVHCAWAAAATAISTSAPLKHANVLSNVDTGTPGTVTVNTADAGGANAGVCYPSLTLSLSSTNPKVWIVAAKVTAAGPTFENRVWRAAAATASPAYTTYNDINSTSSSTGSSNNVNAYGGCAAYWTVSGSSKLTIVVKHKSGTTCDAFTFDPTAASPVLGSATNFTAGSWDTVEEVFGPLMVINAKADYLVFGRNVVGTAATWSFYKTVNGTSWTNPTGWTSLTMGRANLASDGTDFWLLHTQTYGTTGTTAQQLQYRKITTSSDTMGGVTNFSDTNGNPVSVPRDTGTSKLYGGHRASTVSPYSVRSDFVSIGGAADTTPPGSASLTATPNTAGVRVDLSATMPADVDVAQYEIRFLTTGYPASGRSDGTIIVSPTDTSANSVVTFSHTSLTNGTRYYYTVFVKDTSGNWNTGTQATAVAGTPVAFSQRLKSDGVTTVADGITAAGNNPILVYQLATGNFESGKVAHFRLRTGNDQATPPADTPSDYTSSSGGSIFKYEDPASSGTYVDVPVTGLPTTFFARKLRVYTAETAASRWFSLRVEQ